MLRRLRLNSDQKTTNILRIIGLALVSYTAGRRGRCLQVTLLVATFPEMLSKTCRYESNHCYPVLDVFNAN